MGTFYLNHTDGQNETQLINFIAIQGVADLSNAIIPWKSYFQFNNTSLVLQQRTIKFLQS